MVISFCIYIHWTIYTLCTLFKSRYNILNYPQIKYLSLLFIFLLLLWMFLLLVCVIEELQLSPSHLYNGV